MEYTVMEMEDLREINDSMNKYRRITVLTNYKVVDFNFLNIEKIKDSNIFLIKLYQLFGKTETLIIKNPKFEKKENAFILKGDALDYHFKSVNDGIYIFNFGKKFCSFDGKKFFKDLDFWNFLDWKNYSETEKTYEIELDYEKIENITGREFIYFKRDLDRFLNNDLSMFVKTNKIKTIKFILDKEGTDIYYMIESTDEVPFVHIGILTKNNSELSEKGKIILRKLLPKH